MMILTSNGFVSVLFILSCAPPVQGYRLIILPVSLNSWSIPFTDWISLLTLCFAPLIAHIIAGAPPPTILDSTRPRWHDRAVLFNPTSILWRYFAIVDRRLRSRLGYWTRERAAASNAIFWTRNGWDGSKEMITSSRRFIVDLPEKPRAKLLSKSSLQSVIVAAQGVQATWLLVVNLVDTNSRNSYTLAVDTVFVPLAAMGLLRAFPAFWLLDDFSYSYDHTNCEEKLQGQSSSAQTSDLDFTATWGSRILRLCMLITIMLMWTMCLFQLGIGGGHLSNTLTPSLLLANLYYMFWLVGTSIIFVVYFIRGHTNSTIIPCISSVWYKVYCMILTLATIVLIVVVAIETQQLPCGRTSTRPFVIGTDITLYCPDFRAVDRNAQIAASVPFGVAEWVREKHNESSTPAAGEIKVTELTGYYWGTSGSVHVAQIEGY